jgi:hypothetical protein
MCIPLIFARQRLGKHVLAVWNTRNVRRIVWRVAFYAARVISRESRFVLSRISYLYSALCTRKIAKMHPLSSSYRSVVYLHVTTRDILNKTNKQTKNLWYQTQNLCRVILRWAYRNYVFQLFATCRKYDPPPSPATSITHVKFNSPSARSSSSSMGQ